MPPKVCIIILNWNAWEATRDCLRSLENVDYPNFETLVVDNASSDGSVDQLNSRFPSIPIIRNNANLGFAGGNNVGILCALRRKADYVLLLNNDTTVSRFFLRALVEAAEADPKVGLANPKIYYADPPDRIWYAGGSFSLWRGFAKHFHQGRKDASESTTPQEVSFVTGCALLVKSEVIRSAGLLDERFFLVSEDTDWSIRARQAGYRAVYAPGARIWHNESYTVRKISGKQLRDYYNVRNSLLLMRKHARAYHWPPFLVHLASLLFYRTAGYSLTGQFLRISALYRGLFDGLRECRIPKAPDAQHVEI